jgi:hypothetical protein
MSAYRVHPCNRTSPIPRGVAFDGYGCSPRLIRRFLKYIMNRAFRIVPAIVLLVVIGIPILRYLGVNGICRQKIVISKEIGKDPS